MTGTRLGRTRRSAAAHSDTMMVKDLVAMSAKPVTKRVLRRMSKLHSVLLRTPFRHPCGYSGGIGGDHDDA